MNCQDAQPFVSDLYDGEDTPPEAAAHIGGCAVCRARLRKYAEMTAGLRLLAFAEAETIPGPLGPLPSKRRRLAQGLTVRVLVPRFAIGLALVAIVGLSLGLGIVQRQASRPWFECEVSGPNLNEQAGSIGGLLQEGGTELAGFVPAGPDKKVAVQVKAVDVRQNLVRLQVRARTFSPKSAAPKSVQQGLSNIPFQQFDYVPGKKLEIHVEGAVTLVLTGKVSQLRPSFWGFPVTPRADEISVAKAALVRDNQFLGNIEGLIAGRVQATNSAFGVCVPRDGAFVFALNPFPGAIQGVAEYGQIRFKMGGHDYTLYSALPITGGEQPRTIWIFRAPHCNGAESVPVFIGVGDLSDIIQALPKEH